MSTKTPLIIAHRGSSGHAPENTLAAFKLAVDQKADMIELDVHLSKDGELIVSHDDFINRTTNGKGQISEMTVSEIKKYDAGLWYHEEFQGERIPLLDEVFDLVPNNIKINVEIKNIPSFYENIEKKLLDLLVKRNRMDSVVVSSFDHQVLNRLKHLEPMIKIGLLYYSSLVSHSKYTAIFDVPVYSLHPYYGAIQKSDVTEALKTGLEIYPWTVNVIEEMEKLIQYGVTGIITNYPDKMTQLLKSV